MLMLLSWSLDPKISSSSSLPGHLVLTFMVMLNLGSATFAFKFTVWQVYLACLQSKSCNLKKMYILEGGERFQQMISFHFTLTFSTPFFFNEVYQEIKYREHPQCLPSVANSRQMSQLSNGLAISTLCTILMFRLWPTSTGCSPCTYQHSYLRAGWCGEWEEVARNQLRDSGEGWTGIEYRNWCHPCLWARLPYMGSQNLHQQNSCCRSKKTSHG